MDHEYEYCIVGAGLSGSTIARLAAEDGKKVLVIEKRDHIAGNTFDEIDRISGIRISRYGAHIFHTNDQEVWTFVNRFGSWTPWYHKVLADCDGKHVPVPVNIETINSLFNTNIQNEAEMNIWLHSQRHEYDTVKNSEEVVLSTLGKGLYEKLFKTYTFKQWAKYPSELESSVLQRIPVRKDFDGRYFSDRFQALPTNGYTSIVKSMLDHPNIKVKLNCPWTAEMPKVWRQLIFTGPIDLYFKDKFPPLEYRSIEFKREYVVTPGFHQPNSVINYPEASTEYTRCVEYKHFLNQKSPWTILVKEKTTDEGEPYYPVPTEANRALYEKYKELADQAEGVHFVGRLASYKYFNMDQAIRNAMDYYRTTLLLV